MASRKDVRAKVNDALRQRGHEPNGISNVKAARILGLIPQDLRAPCVSSSRLLREWAYPSEPPKLVEWVQKLVRQHEMDRPVSAPLVAKTARKQSSTSARSGPVRYVNTKAWQAAASVPVGSDAFLQTYEWRRVRMVALKLHGARCQACGATPSTGAVMNVDHIKPRKLFPDLALSLENLQVLCHECNHGKGNWDVTDWRPEKTEWRPKPEECWDGDGESWPRSDEENERLRQLELVRKPIDPELQEIIFNIEPGAL